MAFMFTKALVLAKEKEREEELNKRLLEESQSNSLMLEKRVQERTKELE
jgi:hypothetical protein